MIPSLPSTPRSRRRPSLFALLVVLAILLAACGQEADEDTGSVASLGGDAANAATEAGSTDDSTEDDAATEEELLDWVECMREQGVDVADPTVDADGNLTLGGGPGGGAGAGGPGGGPAGDGDGEAFAEAGEACGQPPLTGGAFGFSDEDQTAIQDAALEFTQCMRDLGFDVSDPTFGDGGPGGGPPAADGGGGGGPFGDLDLEDPETAAAFESCQQAFADAGVEGFGQNAPGAPDALDEDEG